MAGISPEANSILTVTAIEIAPTDSYGIFTVGVSRCNPGAEFIALFLAGKGARSEIAWITVTVKTL
jgi:hypothetical protein